MMKTRHLLFGFVLALSSLCLLASDDHHQVGPGEKLGKVFFPTSCAGSVQKPFERGIALLHSFAYEEADTQFQEIVKDDPQCAIAYWGEAMSLYHQLWNRPRPAQLRRGSELLQKAIAVRAKTQRERDYIGALMLIYSDYGTVEHEKRSGAYLKAMENIHHQYPNDHEAAVFYALALIAQADDNPSLADGEKAIAILSRLFAREPDHPGVAHYLIHGCDNPRFAQSGLAAARRYARIAPSSPHALHMPSHIFARLGLWQDDIQSNLAAIQAAKKQTSGFVRDHILHSMEFMEYAYLQIGEETKAKAISDELTLVKGPADGVFADYWRASFPALYALEMRRWNEALSLQPPAGAEPDIQAITYWARAVAAGHLHNAAEADSAVNQYNVLMEATSKGQYPYRAASMLKFRNEAAAWLAFARGKNDEALNLLRVVAEKQELEGKGEVELPAREMLADILLETNRPLEALMEYEKSLHTDPNRFNSIYGAALAADSAHAPEKAAFYYAQLLKNCENGVHSSRPELARAKALFHSAPLP